MDETFDLQCVFLNCIHNATCKSVANFKINIYFIEFMHIHLLRSSQRSSSSKDVYTFRSRASYNGFAERCVQLTRYSYILKFYLSSIIIGVKLQSAARTYKDHRHWHHRKLFKLFAANVHHTHDAHYMHTKRTQIFIWAIVCLCSKCTRSGMRNMFFFINDKMRTVYIYINVQMQSVHFNEIEKKCIQWSRLLYSTVVFYSYLNLKAPPLYDTYDSRIRRHIFIYYFMYSLSLYTLYIYFIYIQ